MKKKCVPMCVSGGEEGCERVRELNCKEAWKTGSRFGWKINREQQWIRHGGGWEVMNT